MHLTYDAASTTTKSRNIVAVSGDHAERDGVGVSPLHTCGPGVRVHLDRGVVAL